MDGFGRLDTLTENLWPLNEAYIARIFEDIIASYE